MHGSSRNRFTLLTLFGVLCLLTLYFAGMGHPSTLWASFALTFSLAILSLALLWRFTSSRANKRFATGFQLAGWTYAAFAFLPWFGSSNIPVLSTAALSSLHATLVPTSADSVLIEYYGTWYQGSILEQRDGRFKIHYAGYGPEWDEWIGRNRLRAGGHAQFLQIGNAMFTLLVALAGGLVAQSIPEHRHRWWRRLLAGGFLLSILLGVAGLWRATWLWASLYVTLIMAVLIFASIGALAVQRPGNAMFVGFALCGWCYLLIHRLFDQSGGSPLLTTLMIGYLHEWIHPPSPTSNTAIAVGALVTSTNAAIIPLASSTAEYFHTIAHSLLTLLVGGLGALLGMIFALRGKQQTESLEFN